MVQIYYENEGYYITQGTPKAAGFDIKASKPAILNVSTVTKVKTGIRLIIPEGYWVQIEGRGGLALKGIFPVGGIVDNDYTGEIIVALANLSGTIYTVNKSDKIAQLVVRKQEEADFIPAHFSSCPRLEYMVKKKQLTRGQKGFGSTGK